MISIDMNCLLPLFFLIIVKNVFSANILHIAPLPSPSHHIWNRALAFGLVNRGHNVTYIGPDEDNVAKPKNYTFILLEDIYAGLHDEFEYNEWNELNEFEIMGQIFQWMDFACEKELVTKGLQKLLAYPDNFFDLIIYDIAAGYCFYPLIHKFKYPPTVGVSPFLLPQYVSFDFGNILQSSYIPWYGIPLSDKMSFYQRLKNFFYTRLDIYLRNTQLHPKHEAMARKVFGQNIPAMTDVISHIDLVLVNTDPLLDYPQPMPPNIVPVGGLHTRKPKEIPAEFKDILEKSKHGVILFSLGTNLRSDKLTKSQKQAILGAFGKLKETVIWKFESENLEGLPKNVIIRKWLPQNDILAHPNVKLFIGHGGSLSTQEGIYHGVPMILIPFIVDQFNNGIRITNKKLGISINANKMTEENFYKQIREVLDNPVYRDNAKKTSERYNDRPESALERGIFWVEYALRHKGADFLKTRAKDLPFYVSYEYDILGFLLIILLSSLYILVKLVQMLCRLVGSNKKIKTS